MSGRSSGYSCATVIYLNHDWDGFVDSSYVVRRPKIKALARRLAGVATILCVNPSRSAIL